MIAKKREYVTIQMLNEAVDAILHGIERMFQEQNKMLDKRFTKIEAELSFVKNDVKDLKNDTPTRSEFERLKKQVQLS